MFRKFFPLVAIGLWGVVMLHLPNRANATTPLTKAEIQDLRNLVQLMPQHRPKRQAHKLDAMIPGDGLSTGRSSLADVRFNDGSLARVGEQALFKFLPKTRNFRVSNGTILMLIPPGKGQTHINTPNAAAAIRGSALFVRYDKETDTTVVGALTNSGIQVFNKDASQSQMLQAGQLMVIVKGKFQGLYDFDLRTFYETSDLVRGLNLTQNGVANPDPAIAKVQSETIAAIKAQSPVTGKGVVENPSFLKPTANSANLPSQEIIKNNYPTNSLLDVGQILPINVPSNVNNTGTTRDLTPTGSNGNNNPNNSSNVGGSNNLGNNNQITPVIRPSNQLENQPPSSTSTTPIHPADAGPPPVTPITTTTPPVTPITTTTPPVTPITTTTPPVTSTGGVDHPRPTLGPTYTAPIK